MLTSAWGGTAQDWATQADTWAQQVGNTALQVAHAAQAASDAINTPIPITIVTPTPRTPATVRVGMSLGMKVALVAVGAFVLLRMLR